MRFIRRSTPSRSLTRRTMRADSGRAHRKVVSMDIDPQHKPMILGDNRIMKGVPVEAIRHRRLRSAACRPAGARQERQAIRRGLRCHDGMWQGTRLDPELPLSAVPEAGQASPEAGTACFLAKITDMVNSHKSRWAHCDFMRMAEEAGFTVCDLIVKIRNGPMMSNEVERGPPRPEATLLLDRLPQRR